MGIPEDPAAGSAQCGLGPYWNHRLGGLADTGDGGGGMLGFQASARGGQMWLSLATDTAGSGEERVLVRSTASVVVKGMITLPW
jgi:predicted PhzF superfamily epimerase YddE/YHI9